VACERVKTTYRKTGNVCVNNIEAGSPKNCCHGKANSITYSDCVCVALVYLNVKDLRRILLSSAAQFSKKSYWT